MPIHRKHAAAMARGRRAGGRAGYSQGFRQGRRLGRCETVIRSIPEEQPVRYEMSVLCIVSGMGPPFSPIDNAVVEALRTQVAAVYAVSPFDDVIKIAQEVKPDLVLVLLGMHMSTEVVQNLKAFGARTAVWYSDDPYYTDITKTTAPHYDVVFTNELSCVEFYRHHGCLHVHHLPLAVDPKQFHPKRPDLHNLCDVCFIGSAYWNRVEFFNQIADDLAAQNIRIFGWWWERLKGYRKLAGSIQTTWLDPAETADYYNGAKIVINLHRSPHDETFNQNSSLVPAWTTNPRTFEICGSGAFQLTDARQDLPGLYIPGRELVVYSAPAELVDYIKYYLKHEEERNLIALNGLNRTLRDHSYTKRVASLLTALRQIP